MKKICQKNLNWLFGVCFAMVLVFGSAILPLYAAETWTQSPAGTEILSPVSYTFDTDNYSESTMGGIGEGTWVALVAQQTDIENYQSADCYPVPFGDDALLPWNKTWTLALPVGSAPESMELFQFTDAGCATYNGQYGIISGTPVFTIIAPAGVDFDATSTTGILYTAIQNFLLPLKTGITIVLGISLGVWVIFWVVRKLKKQVK